jgi:DNA-binding NtrC family response regulator
MNDGNLTTFSSDILVVDDVSENLKLLVNLLTPAGYKVRPASNGAEALDAVMRKKPDLIMLDIKMPGMDGFEVCKRLKADSQLEKIPIIFISALGETDDKVKAFHAGGVDYITKPFQEEEVLMRVQTHIELHRMRMDLESIVAERTSELSDAIRKSSRFYRLVHEVTARLVGARGEEIDAAVDDCLAWTGEHFGVEAVSLGGISKSGELTPALRVWGRLPSKDKSLAVDPPPGSEMVAQFCRDGSFVYSRLEDLDELPQYQEHTRRMGSVAAVFWAHRDLGSHVEGMAISSPNPKAWPDDIVEHLGAVGEVLFNALYRRRADLALQQAYDEIRKLKDHLEAENVTLREEIRISFKDEELIGKSHAFRTVLHQVEQVGPTDSTVLILGETGTGKGLIARRIHQQSGRKDRPLVTVNCAALPATLIESELFGHEKGAFTGAVARKIGRFELADGGTIFLDEVGDLPIELQAKLLRVLHDHEFERVGSSTTRTVDTRVIAATNRDLDSLIEQGTFRADLYYRLGVFPIRIPSLREHRGDIPLLVWFFITNLQTRLGKTFETVPPRVMDALTSYDWPGNVRELRNIIERAMILSPGARLELDDAFPGRHRTTRASARTPERQSENLEDVERAHIVTVLEECDWKVRGKDGAAERLGLKRTTLQSRMKRLGIRRPTA